MAKIEMVKVVDGKHVVTYESGRTRTYQEAPKTVLEWLEASPAPVEEPARMEEPVIEEPVIEEPQTVEVEPQEAPTLEPGWKQGNVGFTLALPPKAEIVPAVPPVMASRSILDRILSLWDGITATVETAWEMYLYPVLTLLLSLLGAVWAVAKAGGSFILCALNLARAGAGRALPVARVFLIQAWGAVAVLALLVARLAILLSETAMAGWKMRQELINEWEAA